MTPSIAATSVTVILSIALVATILARFRNAPDARRTPRRRSVTAPRTAIEFFHPADLLALRAPHQDCEGLFPLARDAHGNLYVVDPRMPDPAVIRIDPRRNAREVVSPSLSEFLRG